MQDARSTVERLVGVYDADGGLLGEAAYVWGRLRGTRHCSLCDVTHASVRRKPAWDAMVTRLGVRFDLLHLNELTERLRAAVRDAGAPVVLTERGGDLAVLLTGAEIAAFHGSVPALEAAVRERLDLD